MIENGVANVETLEEDLIAFLDFDEDANGNNGEEYRVDEAEEAGFETSAAYWASLAKIKYDNEISLGETVEKALYLCVDEFLNTVEKTWMGSCDESEFDISVKDDCAEFTFVHI